jgi:hypothetical protein
MAINPAKPITLSRISSHAGIRKTLFGKESRGQISPKARYWFLREPMGRQVLIAWLLAGELRSVPK